MSVQSEITRIQTARNTLRTKAVALGIGLSTDNITQLATKYSGIVDRGIPDAQVKEGESYTIQPGYYHGGTVQGVAGGGHYELQEKSVTPTKSEQSITKDDGYYGLSTVTVVAIPDAYQDVTDVTATAADVLATKTIVTSNGAVTAGTMQNRGAVTATLNSETTSYTVPAGYHNGSGTVSITTETKTATPTESSQTITPSTNKLLTSVTVNAIPSNYADATDKTATAADIIAGKTAITWDDEEEEAISVTGTMTDNGTVTKVLDASISNQSYTIPAGRHSGSGTVSITLEEKTATPSTSSQTITPIATKVLSKGTVEAIPTIYGDATNANAIAENLLAGKKAISKSGNAAVEITGTMVDNGTVTEVLDATSGNQSYTIAAGKHSGSGTVSITLEEKTVTPTESEQVITPTTTKVLSQVTVEAIPNNYADTSDATGVAANVLKDVVVYGNDSETGEAIKITGTMTNNGAVSPSALSAGASYTIPAGYHNGSGVVATQSLASQTGVDSGKTAVTAATMLTGSQGWVNGTKISGTMANNGAISGTITGLGSVTGDTSYTIPAGYTSGGTVSLTSDIETALAAI